MKGYKGFVAENREKDSFTLPGLPGNGGLSQGRPTILYFRFVVFWTI
jgi:hypothetical protein